MDRFSLRARWVLPVEQPPISGGTVTIENGAIIGVDDSSLPNGEVEDLGDVALLPGLVNAHTHLEFSDLQAPLGQPGMSLPDWIRLVIGDRKRSSRSQSENVLEGLRKSLNSGVTAVADIATAPFRQPPGLPSTLAFQEVIGFSSGRIESAFTQLVERSEASVGGGLSPHAPYTVHPDLLGKIVDYASANDRPVAMHLAESREELELLRAGTGPFQALLEERSMWESAAISQGTTPLDYLRTLSRAPRALVIHGNYLADHEMEFLASHCDAMSLVYCPRTHAFFAHGKYPLRKMLALGVRVVLGTDSLASNPDLSILEEMRAVAASHNVPPQEVIALATLQGAEALDLQDSRGSITTGKRADLIALPCETDEPCEEILNTNTNPKRVWLAGKEVTNSK